MDTQPIFKEIQGLVDLLKKEGKGASLRQELCEKMYDTVSTPVEILEEIDTDLELFSSEHKLSFDIVLMRTDQVTMRGQVELASIIC